MKIGTKRILALLVAGMMTLGLSACTSKTEPSDAKVEEKATGGTDKPVETENSGDKVKVAMVLKTLNSEYWGYVCAGAEAAADELGVDVQLLGPNAETDVTGQVGIIEDALAQDLDAICVAPVNGDAVAVPLEGAKEKGLPILFIDTDANVEGKTSFVGTGNEAAAKIGGDYIAELLGKGKKAVIIRGALGDITHDERAAGYVAGLEAGGMEVLETQSGESLSERGMSVMEDFLTKYPQIDAVLCTNDEMAIGAQMAVEQSGRKDIKIIGFDGNVSAVQMAIDGSLTGSVAQQPFEMGYQGIVNAVKAAKGETIETRIDTGAKMITGENGQEYLDGLKAMLAK